MTVYNFAVDPSAGCWFAKLPLPSLSPCQGRLERAHLISKQAIKREIWMPAHHGRHRVPELLAKLPPSLRDLQWDERVWVPGCAHHHHLLDQSRKLRLRRSWLPEGVEEFAAEFGITWWLDRNYPPLEVAA